ncbi:hypothetical protein BRD05_07895 [Halobacteriales archaeon QS_9_70_65]|nr:MAG: hypothetical protein BRD05_07895 [Halobacteriales archaeon QS_9_70_65]
MTTENSGSEQVVPAGRLARWIYREPQGWRPGLFAILVGGSISVAAPLYMVSLQLAWIAVGLQLVAVGVAEFFPTDRQLSANLLRAWAAGVATGVGMVDIAAHLGVSLVDIARLLGV